MKKLAFFPVPYFYTTPFLKSFCGSFYLIREICYYLSMPRFFFHNPNCEKERRQKITPLAKCVCKKVNISGEIYFSLKKNQNIKVNKRPCHLHSTRASTLRKGNYITALCELKLEKRTIVLGWWRKKNGAFHI